MMPAIGSVIAVAGLLLAAGATLDNDDKKTAHALVFSDGDGQVHSQSIEVTIGDGESTLIINGEEVDVENLEMHDGKVLFLDADGHEIEMHIPHFDGKFIESFAGENGFTFKMPGNNLEFHPPKVVLGVQLAKPHEALTYHLDIDADSSTMLAHVYEGLPASQAGLHTYDVIIEIEGDDEASPDDVRAAISDKEAGDEIRLTVIQEGHPHRVVVELDEYDAAELGQIWVGDDAPRGLNMRFGPREGRFEFAPQQGEFRFGTQGEFKFGPNARLRLIDPEKGDVFRLNNGEWRTLFDDEDIKSFGRFEAFGGHEIDIEQVPRFIEGHLWRSGEWHDESEESANDDDDRLAELKAQIKALQKMIDELEASKKDRE